MPTEKTDYENLLKANYCYKCGNQFTQQEKDAAKEKALIGKIEKAEEAKGKFDKIKDILTLSFITDNMYVKIALIILPLVISLLFGGGPKSNDIMILNSDGYDIYYNTDTDEYFLDLSGESAQLKVSVPSDTMYIVFSYISPYGYTDVDSYELNENIVVQYQSSGKYELKAVTKTGDAYLTFCTV